MTPELSRFVPAGQPPAAVTVRATPAECAALAERLRIPAVESLECRFALRVRGRTVEADGELDARVVQSCVVSLEPVPQAVRERFVVRFVPEGEEGTDDDPDSPDEVPYSGDRIDLGEAAAEQLALGLDPYPRHPDAAVDEGAGEADGGTTSPFDKLAALKRDVGPH